MKSLKTMKTLNSKASKRAKKLWLRKWFAVCIALMVAGSINANPPAPGGLSSNQKATDIEKNAEDLTDEEITEAVELELTIQDGVQSYAMDVNTVDGIVTITGETDNILEKERATKIAKMVVGVRGVINRANVKDSGMEDTQIRENVERALLKDPATDSYEITVRVDDGHVELAGVVDSWREKQLSETVAKGVKGVRSLENNITFDYVSERTDYEIKNDIVAALKWDVLVDDALIDVTVNNGKVVLSGTVGSAAEHSEAEVDAWVTGVESVDASQLNIERWARDDDLRKNKYVQKSDQEIKKAVEDAFLYDPRVLSFNPNVRVENGKVTLSGKVDNLKAYRAAEAVAKNVVGVWKVDNRLKIRFEEIYEDDQIEMDVVDSYIWDPYVENYEIDVEVDNGVATISGEVDNYFEKYHAEDLTSATNGVYAVVNKIEVEGDAAPYVYDYNYYHYRPIYPTFDETPSVARRDLEIKDDIENQIWWSPYVNLSDVNVSVDQGTATLTGTVDTWNEYDYAEKNAYEGGAVAVDNNLVVNH
jgi:osmotically-inducible protein OsmY